MTLLSFPRQSQRLAAEIKAMRDDPPADDPRLLKAFDRLAYELAVEADAAGQPPAPVDPEAQIADLVDEHRRQVAASRARIAETKRRERERVKAIEAEITRLKDLITEERAEAQRSIAADQRLIAIGKAALKVAEEGL